MPKLNPGIPSHTKTSKALLTVCLANLCKMPVCYPSWAYPSGHPNLTAKAQTWLLACSVKNAANFLPKSHLSTIIPSNQPKNHTARLHSKILSNQGPAKHLVPRPHRPTFNVQHPAPGTQRPAPKFFLPLNLEARTQSPPHPPGPSYQTSRDIQATQAPPSIIKFKAKAQLKG